MSTSLDQNFSDLANILMQRRQMQMQQAQQERANRLSDLQMKQLQREDDYQTGLQGAMSNPGVTTSTQIAPNPQPSLANLIPGSQIQPPQFEQPGPQVGPLASRVQTTTTPRSAAQAGADYALSHGKIADYKNFTDLNKLMLNQAAQAKVYGSPEQAAQIETELDKMTKGAALLSSWKKAGGIQYAKAQAAKMPQLFQGTDFNHMSATDAINTFNLPNGQQVVWSDDNPGQLHLTTAPKAEKAEKGYDSVDLGNRVLITPRDGSKPYTLKKGATPKAEGEGGNAPPKGYRWTPDGNLEAIKGGPGDNNKGGGKILPAGQLESIADMKRVKDVLDEAAVLLQSGKITTGPIAGRLQSLGSKVGLADDDFVNLQQKLQTAQNIMLKLRSGAAVTESEYARFLKEYPTPNDTPEVRDRKMKNTINYASTLMDDKMQIYEEGGYRTPQSVKSNGKSSAPPGKGTTVTKGGFKVTVVK